MENIQDSQPTETAQEESVSAPVKASKRGRKPKKGTAASQPIVTQSAPVRTPAMDRLEAEILEIVSKRSAANDALRNAKFTADQAQLQLKNAQEFLFSLEQEVNYRMTLLSQLRGDKQQLQQPGSIASVSVSSIGNGYSNPFEAAYAAPPQIGIGSYPNTANNIGSQPTGIEVVGGRKVRSEGAEAMRAML